MAKPTENKGVKFDGNWNNLPSAKQLLKLAILSLESGKAVTLPTTRPAAKQLIDEMLAASTPSN